jgi:hypothetical protein
MSVQHNPVTPLQGGQTGFRYLAAAVFCQIVVLFFCLL